MCIPTLIGGECNGKEEYIQIFFHLGFIYDFSLGLSMNSTWVLLWYCFNLGFKYLHMVHWFQCMILCYRLYIIIMSNIINDHVWWYLTKKLLVQQYVRILKESESPKQMEEWRKQVMNDMYCKSWIVPSYDLRTRGRARNTQCWKKKNAMKKTCI